MTLDPVHVDGIARLAGRIEKGVDESDHRDFAETVWEDFLDPLVADGRSVLEPVGERRRLRVDCEDAALQERPFPTQHGLDSGTINPTTFKNGLVIDVAQAAMSAVPSDLDLHRARTIVMTAHANDVSVALDGEWTMHDEGYVRERILQTPRVDRYEQDVVHALALYLAESEHALKQAEVVEDLMILDGPVYPTGLLQWADHDPELAELLVKEDVLTVVENYVDLVEAFLDRGVPLIGFVKSTTSKAITRAVRDAQGSAPWANDAAFFTKLLEQRDDEGERVTDSLTCTNWFRSRVGTDSVMAADGDALGVERDLDPEAYEVTFFVVYDPREDILYRVEAPYGVTRDEETRDAITRQVLADVAAERGPPLAVNKADELARIGRDEKAALKEEIERRFDSERQREYDDVRWGAEFDV
ncbi:DNA double-strand break repair nuclease NurA [Halomicrobium salinisoli]|uniref:DNA double-strand break repair nuclease NurA n=1 Tax=Halomicrobium salinisoli TaxID=2878391 RepID=UPI001CEFBA2A|nr:DNA double-strand break repair nuclease NurA [Halomicrobium salinisoli]